MRDSLGPPFVVREDIWGALEGALAGVVVGGRPILVRVGRTRPAVRVFDATTGAALAASHVGDWQSRGGWRTPHVYVDRGRPVLAVALDHEVVRHWTLPDLRPDRPDLRLADPHDRSAPWVSSVASYVADGRVVLVLAGSDGIVRRVDPVSGAEVARPLGRRGPDASRVAAYTVAGRQHLAWGDDEGHLWRWDVDADAPVGLPVRPHRSGYSAIVPYELDSRPLLATASFEQSVWRVDALTGELVGDLQAFEEVPLGLCVAPGPVVVVVEGSTMWRSAATTWEPTAAPVTWHDEEYVESVCTLEVQGRTALFVAAENSIRRFDATTGEPWPVER